MANSKEEKKGFFSRLKSGLAKTHQAVTRRIDELTCGKREISPEMIDDLEELLISADLGAATVQKLIEHIRWQVDRKTLCDPQGLHDALKQEIYTILSGQDQPLRLPEGVRPFVILTVGVNGTGKTTTIAKMAAIFQAQGKSVTLAAADTFRAAAIEQLEIWGGRVGCRVIKHQPGADPSAVAYDALSSAMAQNTDVLIIDTAGRLHTKAPLMDEIRKVHRTIGKLMPGAPHETMMVLDATTGQNAISQAAIFNEALNITGIALTKLDGTAKGGVIVGISNTLQVPVRYIGIGEKIDDLREFDARQFADALFDESPPE